MTGIYHQNKGFIQLLFIAVLVGCKISSQSQIIQANFDSPNISYEGRIGKNEDKKASEIYWSGSSIQTKFEGTELSTTLEDEKGLNFFNVIIDDTIIHTLKLKKGKHTYLLSKELSAGKHSVMLTKRNEWTYGTTWFYGFEAKGSKFLPQDKIKSLSIEFYGDSITTGHGNEDYSGDDKADGNVTNNYNTYAAMTARELNATYTCIARGGIGIMVSWFHMIMPEMYNRLNPNDANSKWDFTKKHPDIVVINLLQNDSWIVNQPENIEFKRRFGVKKPDKAKIINDYQSFVKKIRGHYPDASIICLLGNMDITKENSKWPTYVAEAVKHLKDQKLFTCIVPFKDTKGHPKVKEHRLIANQLLTLIHSEIVKK